MPIRTLIDPTSPDQYAAPAALRDAWKAIQTIKPRKGWPKGGPPVRWPSGRSFYHYRRSAFGGPTSNLSMDGSTGRAESDRRHFLTETVPDRLDLRSVRLTLRWPPRVERLRRVRGDLQMRAFVIRVSTRIVECVLVHMLHDLQDALLAVDVRESYVRLPRIQPTLWPRGSAVRIKTRMDEQAIGEHGNLRRVLNFSRHGPRPPVAISRGGYRVKRQLGWRVHRQRYPVMPRVVHGFLNS